MIRRNAKFYGISSEEDAADKPLETHIEMTPMADEEDNQRKEQVEQEQQSEIEQPLSSAQETEEDEDEEEAEPSIDIVARAMRNFVDSTTSPSGKTSYDDGDIFSYKLSVRGYVDEKKELVGRPVFSEQWTTGGGGGESQGDMGEKGRRPARFCKTLRKRLQMLAVFSALLLLAALGTGSIFEHYNISPIPSEVNVAHFSRRK